MTPQQATIILEVLQTMTDPASLQPYIDEDYSSQEAERDANIAARCSGGGEPDIEGMKYDYAVERQVLPRKVSDNIAAALAGEVRLVDLDYAPQRAFVTLCRTRGITIYSPAFREVAARPMTGA